MLREREALIKDLFEGIEPPPEPTYAEVRNMEDFRQKEHTGRFENPKNFDDNNWHYFYPKPITGEDSPTEHKSENSDNEKFLTREELQDKACKLHQDEYNKIITQDLPIFARNKMIKELNDRIKDEGCPPFPLIKEPKQEQTKQDDKKPEIKQPNPNSGKWCEKDKIVKYPTSKCKTGWATIKGTCVPPPVN